MTWVSWLVFVLYWAVCLGPLRPEFIRQWRFTVPGSIVGWVTFAVAASIRELTQVWWGPLAVAVLVGLGAATSARQWLDETLGGQ